MKKLIEESGLTNKEFAEYYEIPYNTVLQWSKGIRQAPKYLINLIKENRELKTQGAQLKLPLNELEKENNEPITKKGIEKTISTFEYTIYYKGQNGAFIRVPKELLIEQFIALSKEINK